MSNTKASKILIITSANFPYGGAPANLVRLLSLGLANSGKIIYVLKQAGNKIWKNKRSNNLTNKPVVGISYHFTGFRIRPDNYLLKIIDNLLAIFIPPLVILHNKITGKLSLVIVYGDLYLFNILIFLCCKFLGIPLIIHLVEWYQKESIVTSRIKYLKWWNFIFGMKHLFHHFDGMIVSSVFLKKYFLGKRVNENNIYLLPNLVDLSLFESKSLKPVMRDDIIIGYCGSPSNKDGIDDLLLAFKIVNKRYFNSHLLIIGDIVGDSKCIPTLKEKAMQLKILNQTTFTGFVSQTEVAQYLNSCSILILARPSGIFAEAGFPTKLGEYMACKKPVVITKVGDIPKYLSDGNQASLADPDSPESIAEKIIFLIENPEVANRIGSTGYLWAQETLEYKAITKKVSHFLDSLINK